MPFERILVPVDLTERARVALEHAIALASPLGATVDVLFVWRPSYYVAAEVIAAAGAPAFTSYALNRAGHDMQVFLDQLDAGDVELRPRFEVGETTDTILEVAKAEHYDLIVIGTERDRGLWGYLTGSVSQSVARHAPCPVLTVRPPRPTVSELE